MKYVIRGRWIRSRGKKEATVTQRTLFGSKQVTKEVTYIISQEEQDKEMSNFIEKIEAQGWEVISMAKQENHEYYDFLFRKIEE